MNLINLKNQFSVFPALFDTVLCDSCIWNLHFHATNAGQLEVSFCNIVLKSLIIVTFFSQIQNEITDSLNYMVQKYYQGPGIIQETLDAIQIAVRSLYYML